MLDIDKLQRTITGETFIEEVIYFSELPTTNDFCKKLKNKNNIIVITDHQTNGRGRFDNEWISSNGNNLTFTIRKHFDIETKYFSLLNFFFSYYTHIAIRNYLDNPNFRLEIKWPNDLLLNYKKYCGILIESSLNTKFFCIGIGINVNEPVESCIFPARTSLAQENGKDIDITELLISIINTFDAGIESLRPNYFEKIYDLWKTECKIIKNNVSVKLNGINLEAFVTDVQIDGGIKLIIDGIEKVFYSPDVKISNTNYRKQSQNII